jgi:hypothetical protein
MIISFTDIYTNLQFDSFGVHVQAINIMYCLLLVANGFGVNAALQSS